MTGARRTHNISIYEHTIITMTSISTNYFLRGLVYLSSESLRSASSKTPARPRDRVAATLSLTLCRAAVTFSRSWSGIDARIEASCSGPSGIEGEGTTGDSQLDAADADASSGSGGGACEIEGTTRNDGADRGEASLLDAAAAPLRMGGTCAKETDQRLMRPIRLISLC